MPLGGTSTHFRTEAVRRVGGWDAWNVTEDCELGMRLAAAGYAARTLDSATHEEAVPALRAWIRQRSRWVKGFAQTALTMTRAPVRSARAMGVRRYLAALVTVAGVPVVLMSQLVFWLLLWLYAGLRAAGADVSWIEAAFPAPLLMLGMLLLLVGNFAVLLAHVSAVYQQERYDLVRYSLLLPAYWLLASLGAWKGVSQLVSRPHFWEKTSHGHAVEPAAPVAGPVAGAAVPAQGGS
jgi:cellulose synthase/poly-beta-1,6-N-acetylglucosamine synthase-like glycosyltransferase